MDVILYGLVTVLLAMAVFQAFRLHKHYTGTLYPALFANYLEYFWRYQFRQNLSVSSWLKQELGFHRLLYNSVVDQDGHVAQTYVCLLYTSGIPRNCKKNDHGLQSVRQDRPCLKISA